MCHDFILFRMPWQGHPDVLIDRFDVRAHLDYIPDNSPHTESATNEELSREDRLVNYERYRIIVQNDFLGSKYFIFKSFMVTYISV
jgi:arginine/serine-rich splicing factor 16